MAEDENSSARNEDRYSHITIGLRYLEGDTWLLLRALGWNDVGFNFYSDHAISQPVLALKRGLVHFEGAIVWSSLDASDEVRLAALINELLYKQVQRVTHNPALHARLVKLLRAPAMVAEKRKLLVSLGLDLSDAKLAELLAQQKLKHPMFRYGVKVESEAWRTIIHKALQISSVVISMEKWSAGFGKA